MLLIRRKIAKRSPHVGDPPPKKSEKCSKKALYSDKIVYNLSGGGRAPTLASTVDAHAWEGGGANYVSIITVEVNCAKDGNLHMHILF